MHLELQNNLRLARVEANLTQQELAEKADVTRQTIIAIEKGEYVPSTRLALILAHVLHKDINQIFYLSNKNNVKNEK